MEGENIGADSSALFTRLRDQVGVGYPERSVTS